MKHSYLLSVVLVLLFFSCNAAKDIAGSYDGYYSSTGLFFSNDNATIYITEIEPDMVDIEFQSPHYTFNVPGIKVTRKTWSDGEVFYDLQLDASPWIVSGTIYLDGELVYDFANTIDEYYIHFMVVQ